jgi:hypothetical protein
VAGGRGIDAQAGWSSSSCYLRLRKEALHFPLCEGGTAVWKTGPVETAIFWTATIIFWTKAEV